MRYRRVDLVKRDKNGSCPYFIFEGMERDYCYVGDVVKANLKAIKRDSTGIFNIGTGIATKTLDLYNTIYKIIDNQNSELKIPDKASARAGDLRRRCLNIEKAKKSLGWTPSGSLKEGLKKTVEWYLAR